MGGKVWSPAEERVYWRTIVPQSHKRAGRGPLPPKSWEDLAVVMQSTLRDDAKRNYTALGLFEHYFQNIEKGRVSPNATKYVREHKETLARVNQEEEETEIEGDITDKDATISDHSQTLPRSRTGETTEEEEMSDAIDIYEDKENRPVSSTRKPLTSISFSNANQAEEADMGVDSRAYLSISYNFPRPGFNYQHPTSAERSTIDSLGLRGPAPGFEHPYQGYHDRFQNNLAHRRNQSMFLPHDQVPAHFRGNSEDYEPGGRYFCLPAPDYRFAQPTQDYYGLSPIQTQVAPSHSLGFSVSRQQYSPPTADFSPGMSFDVSSHRRTGFTSERSSSGPHYHSSQPSSSMLQSATNGSSVGYSHARAPSSTTTQNDYYGRQPSPTSTSGMSKSSCSSNSARPEQTLKRKWTHEEKNVERQARQQAMRDRHDQRGEPEGTSFKHSYEDSHLRSQYSTAPGSLHPSQTPSSATVSATSYYTSMGPHVSQPFGADGRGNAPENSPPTYFSDGEELWYSQDIPGVITNPEPAYHYGKSAGEHRRFAASMAVTEETGDTRAIKSEGEFHGL
ncbi:hypothetical protein CGLO_03996 [Colletotrichum gloeosporioides Cg-14]|uniref:Uncharacterized protein n=1 Tax=Colletotrichum gloeosporioides (strain Cg-14) TaxID=1237896 RepID=T0KTP7_COLGC|nr:hypothetical protein CGLO_03996 [Colletotrichum gloeosporioides Cg-14]